MINNNKSWNESWGLEYKHVGNRHRHESNDTASIGYYQIIKIKIICKLTWYEIGEVSINLKKYSLKCFHLRENRNCFIVFNPKLSAIICKNIKEHVTVCCCFLERVGNYYSIAANYFEFLVIITNLFRNYESTNCSLKIKNFKFFTQQKENLS